MFLPASASLLIQLRRKTATSSHKAVKGWVLVLLLSAATGCSQPAPTPPSAESTAIPKTKKLKVVATFLPMYWFTKAVAGEKAQVEILIPPGSEVHEYQATPRNVNALAIADVLVKNGLGLEEFLKDTVKNAQNPNLKQIDASKGIQPLGATKEIASEEEHKHEHDGEKTAESKEEKNHAHHHHHPEGNPHVWLDPVLAKQQVENIRDGLIAAAPENKEIYSANATAYIQQLEKLDAEFKERLSKYPNCTFITFHDAFPYLAQRYNLRQVAVVAVPEDNLSPADLQKTVATVKEFNVKALLGEKGTENKLLQTLSQDLKVNLHFLDSLEMGPLDPQYYFTAMQANLQTLEAACK
ncbi:MAG: zinc ABC transporter substrate-binding protein [Oscillatoriaceae bacterium SKW80]|nr:zinc ABC transporter substrate-binding protein [Oscillatoriaceae bacterium SKYG93]MCX8120537.1 zinc ABC transporter substrate-binding protein [Oscillatoriaceae bacterium SKW80]MDW8452775.1 zinc ABC transporter substrate-binding protein [Oscillatoriaceae cyanobacterium SKYGB_i_bin93]HIK27155.1 zinc ABC transporter substrate-binding protein [Oscillatoriaceae cyanobacterium M7585_C2015_266]